ETNMETAYAALSSLAEALRRKVAVGDLSKLLEARMSPEAVKAVWNAFQGMANPTKETEASVDQYVNNVGRILKEGPPLLQELVRALKELFPTTFTQTTRDAIADAFMKYL